MKRILGLDLGTTSIGWALVNEAENKDEQSSIVKLGVRLVNLDNFTNSAGAGMKQKIADAFSAGIGVSTKAARRSAKSARTNSERYKMRRDQLKRLLSESGWINDKSVLCEDGQGTTYETLQLRAKAAKEEISLEQFARVLIMINKKRGYKSNRKLQTEDEGAAIDGMDIARKLYDEGITPGQYVAQLFKEGKNYVPQFYPSDLRAEFRTIWDTQHKFYFELTENLFEQLQNKNSKATWAILKEVFNLEGLKLKRNQDSRKEKYNWRAQAVKQQIGVEELAEVLADINSNISNASGYLGNISDRSRTLFFSHQTIGEYLWSIIQKNRHDTLKKRTFYRTDYLNEFETIWETQTQFHPELNEKLKKQVRDHCIFYQRELKSQKSKLDYCTFESKQVTITNADGTTTTRMQGLRVCPKSSPLYQECKVLQMLNNLEILDRTTFETRALTAAEHALLFQELNLSVKLTKTEILKLIGLSAKRYAINYEEIQGNITRTKLFDAFLDMLPMTGHNEIDKKKTSAAEKEAVVKAVFEALGFETGVLNFDATLEGDAFEQQPSYKLWHLLYAAEDKNLKDHVAELCHFSAYPECAKRLAAVTFPDGYGSLSAKALRKIYPHLREGMIYSDACEAAGYRHSEKSLTKEELEARELLPELPVYRSGALRNPVVDKVLAQMTNVVNSIIATYGKPDEVRIELAREMKKNAKERAAMTDAIKENTKKAEAIREMLQKAPFSIANPTPRDILRWRLYEELEKNGYRTLYSNTYIRREDVFSKDFQIEHIIPQALLFDDSFSNKTLETSSVNSKKDKTTARDFVEQNYGAEELERYEARVNALFSEHAISKTKRDHLLMKQADIPTDFIQRDLRETQYIAREAKAMLEEVVRSVVSTSGSITDYLRERWQLVDVMKELNLPMYDKLGLVRTDTNSDGNNIQRIEGWTKRLDHRHHAMDALTVAFTRRGIIQYLNTLNAHPENKVERDIDCPMPPAQLRREAMKQLKDILISMRISKKVATSHKDKHGTTYVTPRGKLHAETYYRAITYKGETIYVSHVDITPELKLDNIVDDQVRRILQERFDFYGGNAEKAFSNLEESPIWLNKDAGICIKQVTVKTGKVKNPIAIHTKKDHFGNTIVDAEGRAIPADFVAPDNNHHIALYKDANGNIQERVVTFFEAVERKRQGLPPIDKTYKEDEGWQFVVSMQRGDYFIFPNKDFYPQEIDLLNPENMAEISPNLFLVQKLTSRIYTFRHHLDPTTDEDNTLQNIRWKRISSFAAMNHSIKVRLNILGEIVETQEIEF